MYNYGRGSTAGGFMGNLGAFDSNTGNSQYINQSYLPNFGMKAQQNPGPMPQRTVAGMGNMGGLGRAGQVAGQFNDPMTIKKVY